MFKWNEYTWYSKWASLIFFILVLPILTFYIGMKYDSTKSFLGLQPNIAENTLLKNTGSKLPKVGIINEDVKEVLLSQIYPKAHFDENSTSTFSWYGYIPDGTGTHQSNLLLVATSTDATSTLLYIVAETPNGNCHACGAQVGIGIFKSDNGSWTLIYKNNAVEENGEYGSNGKASLFKIGPHKVAVAFDNTGGGMGHFSGWKMLYYFDGVKINNIGQIFTSANSDGLDCKELYSNSDAHSLGYNENYAYSSEGTIETVPVSDSDFYSLTVHFTGTEIAPNSNGCKLIPVNRIDTYKWNGSEYKIVK